MDCPPGYKELQSYESIHDLIHASNEYDKRKPWTFTTTKRPEVEDDCGHYTHLNFPCPPGYRKYLEDQRSKNPCPPYSEYNLPCPPDYEPYTKPAVTTKPSISETKIKPTAKNKKRVQERIKNIQPYSCADIRYLEHYLGGYTWYPTPYGIKHLKKWGEEYVNEHFLGKYSTSASLYTIFPFMTAKAPQKHRKMYFHSVPMFMLPRRYPQHRYVYSIESEQIVNPEYAEYFNVFGDDYVGMCQQPLKKDLSEIKCESTIDEIKCNATCVKGYHFPENTEFMMNVCWHVTGVWRPQKNFPDCKPLCDEPCQNGGTCIKQGKCKCPSKFRGNRCEFNFLQCDIRLLIAEQRRIGWVCHHFTNGTICKVRCKEPAQFEYPPADEYKCTPEGLWTPEVLPRCILKED